MDLILHRPKNSYQIHIHPTNARASSTRCAQVHAAPAELWGQQEVLPFMTEGERHPEVKTVQVTGFAATKPELWFLPR